MKYVILLFIAIFISNYTVKGQITLSGSITEGSGEPVKFANVILRQFQDTTKIADVVISDMRGIYIFPKHGEGKYILDIQVIGYEALADTVLLRRSSVGSNINEVVKNYILKTSVTKIDGIVVEDATVTRHLERTDYHITNNDRRLAINGFDLINKIPQISLDRVNLSASIAGNPVTIFINGIASSIQDLQTLSPSDIKSLEYYDLPPIRYGGNGQVVNVITKEIVDGVSGGINLRNGITASWLNDDIYFRYNRKRSQISVRYYASLYDYKNLQNNNEYLYKLNGHNYFQKNNADNDIYGFYNDLNIQYINQLKDNYTFQANFYPSFRNSGNNVKSLIGFYKDDILTEQYGNSGSNVKVFNPSVDLYLWKQLKLKQELIFSLSGNYFNSSMNGTITEYSSINDAPILEDFQKTLSGKYSIIGQGLYVKNFEKITLSFGERFSYEKLNANTQTSFGSTKDNTAVLRNYFTGELTGKIGSKFSYRFSLGVDGEMTEVQGLQNWQWIFAPQIITGLQISKSFILRAGFSQANTSPKIGMYNERIAVITNNIISKGNSKLKTGFANQSFLSAGLSKNWIDATLMLKYTFQKNPINYYYLKEDQYFEYSPRNDHSLQATGLEYSIQLLPFRNRTLVIKLNGGVSYMAVNSSVLGEISYWYTPLSYEIQFNKNDFSVYYQGSITTGMMQPPLISHNPIQSTLGVSYKYKSYAFYVNCSNFLTKPHTSFYSINGSLMQYSGKSTNKNLYNFVTIGISYTFNKGRKYNETERKIINKDNDSGL